MSLVGNLEDLGLGEILQIVSLSRKSGILALHSRGREGRVVFRQGQVVRATSTTFQESLGEVLVRQGVIDLPTLRQALSVQEEEGFQERLGTILIKRYATPVDKIEDVVREQIEKVVYSLFSWAEGTFEFELQDNVEVVDDTKMDPLQFMLDQGLNPQFLAMEGSRIIDEKRHRGEDLEADAPLPDLASSAEESVDISFGLLETAAASPQAPAETPVERTLLVMVDNDVAIHQALVAPLSESGFDVSPFVRSEAALAEIEALYRGGVRPAVLVDLIMPRMDGTGVLGGVELLGLVKNKFPGLSVLAMADYHNSAAEREVRRMGFPLIMKPRSSEICSPELARDFAGRLMAEIARVEAGGGPSEWRDSVNLGDELRLEMGEEPAPATAEVAQSTGIAHLRGMLEELNGPALGGGIILLVLRFASEFMDRAVIFIVKRDEISGLGQFGIHDEDGPDSKIRNLRIPRGEESIFTQVIETQSSAKLQPTGSHWNRYLLDRLGGGMPDEVFLGPIVSEGKVVAVLYGDNLPERKPIGDTDSLEIFLSQAGLAMEKALLQRRLKEKSTEGM